MISELLSDQYAYRPAGSTTAALVAILNDLTCLLENNRYVHIIALDFSKAFDTVRHSTLMDKIAQFPLPDRIYNWLEDYLHQRVHCTKTKSGTSPALGINSSVVQGSAVGPIAFILNASDLKASAQGNILRKYADDTYLICPATNSHTIAAEMTHIAQWADNNNLRLNPTKSTEMIVHNKRYGTQLATPRFL